MKIRPRRFPHVILLLAFILSGIGTPVIRAERVSLPLPATFVQITSTEDITEQGFYLIGSTYSVTVVSRQLEGFRLMSTTVSNNNSYLKAVKSLWPRPQLIECEKTELVWQFKQEKGTTCSIHPATDPSKSLYANKPSNSTNLQLGSGSKRTLWTIRENGDGTFLLNCNEATNRYVGINWLDESDVRFGNYTQTGATNHTVYIYKMATEPAEIPGNAVLPANNSRVTLCCKEQLAGRGMEGIAAAPYILNNGSIAPDECFGQWTCRHKEAGTFLLETSDHLFLNYELDNDATEHRWKISDGHIVPAEETNGRLMYLPAENRFSLVANESETEVGSPIFMSVGNPPSSTSGQGVRILYGAWSAERLAKIDLKGIYALDLSHISLPRNATGFSVTPSDTNLPVYISEADVSHYPAEWDFVVCDNQLLKRTVLKDKCAFLPDREIKISEQAPLVYQREIINDGNWETLCLPFDFTLPSDFQGEVFGSINGQEISFHPVRQIQAHTPVILHYNGNSTEATVPFEVESVSGTIKTEDNKNGLFFGTYLPLTVESEIPGIYLLNTAGNQFVHAAKGSRLSPFRAYLQTETAPAANPYSVLHLQVPANVPHQTKTPDTPVCHTTDGKRMHPSAAGMLPHDVYIINGKKIVK